MLSTECTAPTPPVKTYNTSAAGGQPPRRGFRLSPPRLDDAVFIVGAPRSGTTFLGELLSRLPEVAYHFEPPHTKRAARFVYEGAWSYGRARWYYRARYAWLILRRLEGGRVFVEKTPRNAFLIPFLSKAFPRSRFVHIIRDGRDVVASLRRKPWLRADSAAQVRFEPGGYQYGPFPRFWVENARRAEFRSTSDTHRCIWSWRRHVEAALAPGRLLPAERYLELRYEELVGAPDEQLHRLLDFLGIYMVGSRAAVMSFAHEQAHAQSIGGWRKELSEGDLAQIDKEAGALLQDLGYR
jgi:hypothetical protein